MVARSVLGLPWDTEKDVIHLSMDVNLSPKKQGVRTEGSLGPEDEEKIKDAVLTRRQLMSQIHSIYDPLGLLSPITIKFKLVLQELVQAQMDWDEPLEGELKKKAETSLIEMARSSSISFPRCVLGEQYNVKPGWMLIGFWDGGNKASACCLYARTPLKERGSRRETHLVRLLAAKA